MCLLCSEGPDLARRDHVLSLLALVEDPDALPVGDALRLAQEILALTRAEAGGFRCDAVPPGAGFDEPNGRGKP